MNILQQGKLVNTPVGQLIISAAVIDDMIALIILSQLKALSGPVQVTELVVPIVSAFLFLGLGGYLAIAWAPTLFEMLILKRVKKENRGQAELGIMLTLLIVLIRGRRTTIHVCGKRTTARTRSRLVHVLCNFNNLDPWARPAHSQDHQLPHARLGSIRTHASIYM